MGLLYLRYLYFLFCDVVIQLGHAFLLLTPQS